MSGDFERWVISRGARPGTARLYGIHIRDWLARAIPAADYIAAATSPQNANTKRCALRKWAEYTGETLDIPPSVRRHPRVRFVLEPTDLLYIQQAAESLPLLEQAALAVLIDTGLRNFELRALRLDDVDLDRADIVVLDGKGGKQRRVPIEPETVALLRAYIRIGRARDAQWLFPGADGERLHEKRLNARVRALYARAAALAPPESRDRLLRAAVLDRPVHLLRICCATHLMRLGVAVSAISALLGHGDERTTQGYIVHDPELLHRSIRDARAKQKRETGMLRRSA